MASAFNNQVSKALVFVSQNLKFLGLAPANFQDIQMDDEINEISNRNRQPAGVKWHFIGWG